MLLLYSMNHFRLLCSKNRGKRRKTNEILNPNTFRMIMAIRYYEIKQ